MTARIELAHLVNGQLRAVTCAVHVDKGAMDLLVITIDQRLCQVLVSGPFVVEFGNEPKKGIV